MVYLDPPKRTTELGTTTDVLPIYSQEGWSTEHLTSKYVTAILSIHYPGEYGSKLYVHPKALDKFGPPLYERLHNICQMIQTRATLACKQLCFQITVNWDKGVPVVMDPVQMDMASTPNSPIIHPN
jgi:hypothetical protein